ncbi:MAG: hypothetical protein ACLRL4_04485 [Bifidobacterium bifidum]
MAGYARLSNGFWQDKDILKLRRMNPLGGAPVRHGDQLVLRPRLRRHHRR